MRGAPGSGLATFGSPPGDGNEMKQTATKRIACRNESFTETNESPSMKSLLCGLEDGTYNRNRVQIQLQLPIGREREESRYRERDPDIEKRREEER